MFIIDLTYMKPIEEVEKYLAEHVAFLDTYYQKGQFICSGRKNPRTGGIILALSEDKNKLQTIIAQDPFYQNEVAAYTITEFVPTKYAAEFAFFAEKANE